MKKERMNVLLNPFTRVAGFEALLWGGAGVLVSGVTSYFAHWHYHGLLHFGAASNQAWWCFAVEHLAVWLIPAVLFYTGGLFLSRSRVRPIDVFGTVAFAQIPLIGMNLFAFLPPMQQMLRVNLSTLPLEEIMKVPGVMTSMWLSMLSMIFLVWALIWMFKALKVSCNLKGWRLGVVYGVAVIGGDVLCRVVIGWCYL